MINDFYAKNSIYYQYKNYLETNSQYKDDLKVAKYILTTDKHALIVFNSLTNDASIDDSNGSEINRMLSFDINIYTSNISAEDDAITVGEEIANVTLNFFNRVLKMNGGLKGVFPNVDSDNSTCQYDLKFNGKYITHTQTIY